MKKIYTSLLLCCAIGFANAQWTSNINQNTLVANANASDIQTANTNDGRTWIAFYSQRGNNYDMRAQLLNANGEKMLGDSGALVSNKKSGTATFVFNVCVDNNNNLVIAFQFHKEGNYECIIQKISTSGKLLWNNGVQLGTGLSPYPVTLKDNEIAVAWNNNNKIDYQKISAAGVLAWSAYKEFSGSGVSRPQLVANTDGGFSMVYQSLVYYPFYTNLYEQRFDADGNAVWATAAKISTLTTASYRYYDIHIDNDSTYVGYYGNPSGSNRFDAYVQKINPNGTVKWGMNGRPFADYSGENDPFEQTIYIAKDKNTNDVWAVCTITNSLQTQSGVYVQKFDGHSGENLFDNNGKVVFPVSPRLISLAFSQLSLCSEDPIFLVTDSSNRLAAMKLNTIGNNAWINFLRPVSGSKNVKFRYGFTDVYNGQAVAVWQEDKGNGDMPYAQNIRCLNGNTGPETNNINEMNAVSISGLVIKNIYPNPVENILSVTIVSSTQRNIHIYVTDVSGNILKQFQKNISIGTNLIQLNVSGIKAGTYFIKAVDGTANAGVIFNKY